MGDSMTEEGQQPLHNDVTFTRAEHSYSRTAFLRALCSFLQTPNEVRTPNEAITTRVWMPNRRVLKPQLGAVTESVITNQ